MNGPSHLSTKRALHLYSAQWWKRPPSNSRVVIQDIPFRIRFIFNQFLHSDMDPRTIPSHNINTKNQKIKRTDLTSISWRWYLMFSKTRKSFCCVVFSTCFWLLKLVCRACIYKVISTTRQQEFRITSYFIPTVEWITIQLRVSTPCGSPEQTQSLSQKWSIDQSKKNKLQSIPIYLLSF